MTRDELIEFFDQSTAKMRATLVAKNADYAGGAKAAADCFANFTRVEALGIATTSQGFLTSMTDKLMRINSLTKQVAQVKEETITDTLIDLANYSILFAAWLSTQKDKPNEQETPPPPPSTNVVASTGFITGG